MDAVCDISIVVPVYNVEQYLRRCIDSILNQTYGSFQVILVDDGSTDASGYICDEYSSKFSNIKVIHKQNGGLSSARNAGLDIVQTKYVYFVDSDDELFCNTLEILKNRMQDGVDMVTGGYIKCDENGHYLYKIPSHIEKTMEVNDFAILLSKPLGYESNAIACIHLLKMRIINLHNLRFDEKLRFCEDTPFIAQYICYCKGKVHLTTLPIYKYYFRSTSLVGSAYAYFKESTYDILLSKLYVYKVLKQTFIQGSAVRAAAVKAFYTYIDMLDYSVKFNKLDRCKQMYCLMRNYFSWYEMFVLKCRNCIRRIMYK